MALGVAVGALALCLAGTTPSGPTVTAQVPLSASDGAFTIQWMHSIEKTQWTEHWQVRAKPQPHLYLRDARIETSGAGMDIPDNAVWRDGGYTYDVQQTLTEVTLSHSPFTAQATLCSTQQCQQLADWLPGLPAIAAITLTACPTP